jgi:hypothetical protein
MRLVLSLLLLLALVFSGCDRWQLLATGKDDSLLAPRSGTPMAPLNATPGGAVPRVDLRYKADWDTLCKQCHSAPGYNSARGMTWQHKRDCLSIDCLKCHGQDLHSANREAGKQLCFDCHLKRYLELRCDACHTAELVAANSPHDAAYAAKHPVQAAAVQTSCLNCHGSESWCTECHGVPMPHPADIAKNHEDLAKTASCVACHGRNSCKTCHHKHGVVIKQPQEGETNPVTGEQKNSGGAAATADSGKP